VFCDLLLPLGGYRVRSARTVFDLGNDSEAVVPELLIERHRLETSRCRLIIEDNAGASTIDGPSALISAQRQMAWTVRSTDKISSPEPKNEPGHRKDIAKNYLSNRLLVLVN